MGRLQKIVTFDFDGTLCMRDGTPNEPMLEIVRLHAAEGYKCYVVSERIRLHDGSGWVKAHEPDRIRIKEFIEAHNLPIKQVHFTNEELKGPTLWKIGSVKHYDDRFDERHSAFFNGIEAVEPVYNTDTRSKT